MSDTQEPQLASIHITKSDDGQWQWSAETVAASDAGRIGLSARDVRWLLGIPEPPRQPMSYETQLRRCKREKCTFVPGISAGWEVCSTHGVARKKQSA